MALFFDDYSSDSDLEVFPGWLDHDSTTDVFSPTTETSEYEETTFVTDSEPATVDHNYLPRAAFDFNSLLDGFGWSAQNSPLEPIYETPFSPDKEILSPFEDEGEMISSIVTKPKSFVSRTPEILPRVDGPLLNTLEKTHMRSVPDIHFAVEQENRKKREQRRRKKKKRRPKKTAKKGFEVEFDIKGVTSKPKSASRKPPISPTRKKRSPSKEHRENRIATKEISTKQKNVDKNKSAKVDTVDAPSKKTDKKTEKIEKDPPFLPLYFGRQLVMYKLFWFFYSYFSFFNVFRIPSVAAKIAMGLFFYLMFFLFYNVFVMLFLSFAGETFDVSFGKFLYEQFLRLYISLTCFLAPSSPNSFTKGNPPILVIGDIGSTPNSMRKLVSRLRKQGYANVFMCALDGLPMSNVGQAISTLYGVQNKPIIVISHGMSGVIIFELLRLMQISRDSIHLLITIGVPFTKSRYVGQGERRRLNNCLRRSREFFFDASLICFIPQLDWTLPYNGQEPSFMKNGKLTTYKMKQCLYSSLFNEEVFNRLLSHIRMQQ
ncbi:hypothetical protein PCE1_001686 [Barthelona sp. PCE]